MIGTYRDHHINQMHTNGTTASETFAAILPSPLATIMTLLLDSLLYTYVVRQRKWQFVMEFIILVLPVILSITVLTTHLKQILVILIVIIVNLILLIYNKNPSKSSVTYNRFKTDFLTNARSTINILSVIAILAVDFNIFPRYFAKTESFGYSLMDVGVGLFMFSNGIVAPEARRQNNSLRTAIKSTFPLFFLGLARFIFVKQTDYNVPVSEYGIHWNFFITLAVTKIVCIIILNVIRMEYILINAIFVIIFHEMLLQIALQKYVLLDIKRNNIIIANKEGLSSCLGYIFIYLISVYFGHCLCTVNRLKNEQATVVMFIKSSLLLLITFIILQHYFGISRKLANSAYCFWVLFIGIFMTGLYYFFQLLLEFLYRGKLQGTYAPLIFEAINFNGLIFFLLGNLLTGLINIACNTLTISNPISLAILTLYMFINCLVVTILYCKQYKCKF